MYIDTLTLVEQHELPALPEPRSRLKHLMAAIVDAMDAAVDMHPSRAGILPTGCWWMPEANLILAATPCEGLTLCHEVEALSTATGLDSLLVRSRITPTGYSITTFDLFAGRRWHVGCLLWVDHRGAAWLIRNSETASCARLSRAGIQISPTAPYDDEDSLEGGLRRGAARLSCGWGRI